MKKHRSAFVLEKLEPRLLFSADMALLPIDAGSLAVDQDVLLTAPTQFINDSAQVEESVDSVQREVIFLDTGVEDYQQLLADIQAQAAEGRQFETVLLDSNRDGIDQISAYLQSHQDISAVHIFSHGSAGETTLGNSTLNLATLNEYASQLESWQNSLTADADLLFYGCNLAANDDGQSLILSLSLLTGADVAASDDLTGAAALGGDWDLEETVGQINTEELAPQDQWQGTLATFTVNTTADTIDANLGDGLALDASGNTSLRAAVMEANASAGEDTIILPSGTYLLNITSGGPDQNYGDLDVDDLLHIIGDGASSTIIDGNLTDRIFDFVSGASGSSLSGVTLQNGDPANADGGAIATNIALTITDAELINNTGKNGGAIFANAALTLERVTIANNTASSGGAIVLNAGDNHSLTNVTIFGNEATNSSGGGLDIKGSTSLTNVTIANNSAFVNGGGINIDGAAVSVSNSLIADNTATGSGNDVYGAFTSDESNLVEDIVGSTGFENDLSGNDPNLQGLINDGGEIRVVPLGSGSDAIDSGDITSAAIVDARGYLRSDGLPDIGAYEVGTSAAATADYLDQFNAIAYDGDDGALPWSNDWQEIGESDGVFYSGPGVSVYDRGGWGRGLYLYNAPIGAWREADLSGADTATLSFDWAAASLGASDSITVEISTDGGLSWDVIDTFGSDSALQGVSYDISAYIDSDTRIKFESTVLNGEFFVDNVQITLGTAASPVDNPATFSGDAAYSGNEGDTGSGDLDASDADGLTDGSYFTIKSQGTFGSASIDSVTGVWSYTPSNLDWSGSDSFTVTVTDDLGGTTDQLISIDLAPVNDAPLITTNTLTISQGETVTLSDSMLAASDIDNSAGELTLTVSTVSNGHFEFISSPGAAITSFTQQQINDSEVVFVHDGGELAPTYSINVFDGSATSADLAATVSFTGTPDGVLWLTTDGDVSSGGQSGTDTWLQENVVQIADPNLSFAPATTDGTFSVAFDLSHFGSDKNIAAVHYVSTDIQIGTTNFQLKSGDVLFSVLDTNLTGNSSAPESGFTNNILTVKKDDVVVFRPDNSGDYKVGSFALLLDEPFGAGTEIWAMTLIEKDTIVGDVTLEAGNFLFAHKGGEEHSDIRLYTTGNIGEGTTSGTEEILIEGDDTGVKIDTKIYGLDLIETELTIGGRTLQSGTILVSVDSAEGITTGDVFAVTEFDIFALDVQATSLGSGIGNGLVTASLFFDGSDLSFDESKISGLTLTVENTATNNIPIVGDVAVAVDEDGTTVNGSFVVTDDDVTDTHTFTITSVLAEGSVVNNNDGTFTFDPGTDFQDLAAGETRDVSFDYTANDGTVDSTAATVTVTMTGSNDTATISGTSTAALTETDVVQSTGGSLTVSDADSGENVFVAQTDSAGDNGYGLFSIDAAGDWTYTMNTAHDEFVDGVAYTDSFTVASADGTDTQLVTVTITGANDTATISGTSTAALTETDVVQSTGGSLTVSDADSGENVFVAQTDSAGDNGYGLFSIDAAGDWTYTMNTAHDEFVDGVAYTDSFTVASADGTDTQLVTVTITGANDTATISGTSTAALTETDVVQSTGGSLTVSDADSGENVFVAQTDSAGDNGYGLFSIDAAGDWTYTMNTAHDEFVDGVAYTDSFTVASADGTDTQLVTVTITGANDTATISGTSTAALTETDVVQSTGGTLSVSDVDSGENVFVAQTDSAGDNGYGLFSIDSAGDWTYTMNTAHDEFVDGVAYTDSFTVASADGTDTQLVTVTITGANDTATISGTSTAALTETDVVQSTGGTLSVSDVDSGENVFVAQTDSAGDNGYGLFSIDSAGDWTYTMNTAHDEFVDGVAYTDSFTVASADGTDTQIVTVTMTGSNDTAIITSSALVMVDEDSLYSYTMTVDDADLGDVLTLSAPTLPSWLSFDITTGVLSGTPSNTEVGDHSVVLRVNDGTVNVDQAFTITVTNVNDAPTAANDNLSVIEDHALTMTTITDLLNNDSDPEGDTLTLAGFTQPGHGTLIDNGDGSLAYTPDSNFSGTDSFDYTISDGNGGTASGTAFIYVVPVGDTPQVGNASVVAGSQSEPIHINRNATDGAEVTHFRISGISGGTLYQANGTTQIHNGDYITVAQGQAGVRFTAAETATGGGFQVEASEDGFTVAAQSGLATSTISITPIPVVTVPDVEPPIETVEDIVEEDLAEEETETVEEILEEETPIPEAPPLTPENPAVTATAATAKPSLTTPFAVLLRDGGFNNRDEGSLSVDGQKLSISNILNALLETNPIETLKNSWDALDISALTAREYDLVRNSFDALNEEYRDETHMETAVISSAVATSIGLSAGYVVWMLKGGSLLASVLSSMPAWHLADPLSILSGMQRDDEDDESLESILNNSDSADDEDDENAETEKNKGA